MPTYVNAHVPWFNLNRYLKSNSTQWSESSVTLSVVECDSTPCCWKPLPYLAGKAFLGYVHTTYLVSEKLHVLWTRFTRVKYTLKTRSFYRRVIGRVLRTKDAVWTYSYPVWPGRQRVFSNMQVKLLPSESQVQIGGEWNVRNCCLFEKLAAAGWSSPLRCFTSIRSRVPSFNCVCKSVLMFFTNKHVHF